jgi:sugar lactone lactonase YvrE
MSNSAKTLAPHRPSAALGWLAAIRRLAMAGSCLVLVACGGGGGVPPPLPVAPAITQQPVNLGVTEGQAASFTVAASGSATLAYQWQRNGVNIAGANGTTYTLPAGALADSGAQFRALVSNAAGSATSNAAVLTVTASVPVLTVTQQPADTSVVAGTPASFSVAATCSGGTLGLQWQRSSNGLSWTDIAAATTSPYNTTTAIADSGAQFRAVLNCSGASITSSQVALLSVTPPASVTLAALPVVGLRNQAPILGMKGIDQNADGSFNFISGTRVKRLSADFSTITALAGNGDSAVVDGPAATASFASPIGLAHDTAGNVYVTDNATIRRIAPDGTVSTLAGVAGADGRSDGAGAAARFSEPHGIALGPDGDLYVADAGVNHTIRRVTTAGVVSTYAGMAGSGSFRDGAALVAWFNRPTGVAVAANGDVLVGDAANHRIRRILRSGNGAGSVQTLAGSGVAGGSDGIGAVASLERPSHVVVRGNTLTVRELLGVLRQVDLTSAAVTTLTGTRTAGESYADGTAATARIYTGFGLSLAANGGFMLSDNTALRVVSASGDVRSVAGSGGIGEAADGVATLAQMPFGSPQAVTVDPAGNVVIADRLAKQVRRISPAGAVTLAAGLVGSFGIGVDGVGSEASFLDVGNTITSDSAGVLYVGDRNGVRRIGAGNATTLLAGSPFEAGALDGNAATARFSEVFGVAVGSGGNVFVGDAINHAVRRIDPAGNVSTYAGVIGQNGLVDGAIAVARFRFPGQLAFAPDGALYVADSLSATVTAGQNGVIRRIAPDGASVSTVAGVSLAGAFAVDAAGTLYYGSSSGLMRLPLGGASTLLIPRGNAIVLGSQPSIGGIDALAVLGAKRLVILSGGQILQATLP